MSDPDFSHAAAFLACLAPGETQFTFQTFHDQIKGDGAAGAVVHGTLDQLGPYLAGMQAAGHGVFWTVNRTDLTGRELHNVTTCRAVWLDLDDPATDWRPIAAVLQPHCVVESSPGKHHMYWRVDDLPVPAAQVMLRALRLRWGGDPGATGVNRVLRLPGFRHLKSTERHFTRIVDWRPDMGAYQVAHLVHYLLGGLTPEQLDAEDVDTALHAGPVEGWRNTLSDEELSARLNGQVKLPPSATAAFGGGEEWTLHELWAPDMHALEAGERRSEARMALLTRMMYLTGGDSARVHEMVKDHPLAVKDGRQGLLARELGKARATFLKWWEPEYARRQQQREETRQLGEGVGPGAVVTPTVMTLDQMLSGLVFVGRGKGVVVRATKQAFRFEDAAAWFAGSREERVSETGKVERVPILPMWLTHPEQRLTVGLMTWRPSEPEFCEPMEMVDGHGVAYNTWRGLRAVTAPQDWQQWAAWFEYHVTYLVPVETERRRFLQWLAHIVQKPGELPHTAYLMVTKTTGTGRNWLASVLARVLQGYCALGVSLGPILDGKFNGILSQKLLATVDEVREGMDGDRYARGEALKKLITEERRQIDHKYGLQLVEQNCARWLIFSNHESDALPFDNTDRRLNVIANPEHRQSEEYYATLYGLLASPQFIASVRFYLESFSLDGFNAGAPAQLNAAKERMIESMTGALDKAVAAFVKRWTAPVCTLRDVGDFCQVMTGEKPRSAALRHVLRRAGLEQMPEMVVIDGLEDSALSLPGRELVPDVIGAIRAARARAKFQVVEGGVKASPAG